LKADRTSRWNLLLAWLIALGSLARAVVAVVDSPSKHLFSDPARHWDNAVNFFTPGLMGGCDPIGYQLYVFAVRWITFESPVAIGVITGLLSILMPWTFYRAARSFGMPRAFSMAFWAAMCWLPSFFAIYRYFMMETLLLPLIGLGLWMTGRAIRKKSIGSLLWMTIFWSLAVMTKAQAIPLAVICFCYAVQAADRRWVAITVSALVVCILMIPNSWRTNTILGYPAPLGSGYIAQIMHASGKTHTRFVLPSGSWIYSSPSCYIAPLEPLNDWRIERGMIETMHLVKADSDNGRKDWDRALKEVGRSSETAISHLWENFILFLFAPSWPDSGKDYFLGLMNHWLRWIWAPLLFHLFIGNALIFRRLRFPLIPVATSVMVLMLMFQNAVTMEGRYRKPVEPLVLLNVLWLWTPVARRIASGAREAHDSVKPSIEAGAHITAESSRFRSAKYSTNVRAMTDSLAPVGVPNVLGKCRTGTCT